MKNPFGPKGPPGWLVTGGIGAVAVGYVFLAFLPAQKSIRLMQRQLRDKQEEIAATHKQFTGVTLTRTKLDQAGAYVKQWQKDAPAPPELSRLYAQISDKARLAGVQLLRLDPQPPRTHALITENLVTVGLEGSLEGVFEFFQGVEGLPQTIWLDGIHLQKAGEKGETLRCDMTLTIFGESAD